MAEEGSTKQKFRVWTAEEDDVLVASLLQLHEEGSLLADNGFKPGVFKQLHSMLLEKIPGCNLKIHPNIISRLKTLKLNWQVVNDMVNGTNTSGFGWDPERKCVIAEKFVWDEYIKSNKKAAQFRGKPFPHFDVLCIIFAKDRATGKGSLSGVTTDQVGDTEEAPNIDNGGNDDNEETTHVDLGVETDPSITAMNGDDTAALSKNKKRRRNSHDDFVKALQKMMNNTCEGMQNASANLGAHLENIARGSMLDIKREALYEEISKLEELTETEQQEALLKITTNDGFLVVFSTLPYKAKLDMAKRLLS